MQVGHSKSQLRDDKLSLKGAWSHHVTHFKVSVPLKYLWNGLRLQIMYIDCPCEVLVFRLKNSPSSRRGLGHVTSLNFGT